MSDTPVPEPDDAQIEELLFLALERLDADGPAAVERLLAEHPAAAARVRSHLERMHRAGLAGGGAPEATTAHPKRLGEFRIVAPLGHGGMGVVYRAVQESLGREVALKVIRPEQLFFPGARERFRREVDLVARMQHPGIVPVYAVGSDEGVPYFAMELVRGASLADVLTHLQGRSPKDLTGADLDRAVAACLGDEQQREPAELFRGAWIPVVLRIVREVAEALEHAHRRSVLHRDVKPSNVMLTRDGRVLLLDFGLAGSDGGERLTRTGSALGSLAYMPPELLAGDAAARDERGDVYSLGATLWELLALRLPYQGSDPVQLQRLAAAASRPKLAAFHPAVTWDVETVVATALEPEPARRYASASSFARDLDHVLAHRPIEAREAGVLLRLRRWTQRHPARATAAVAAALVLTVGPSLWAWQESRARAQVQVQRDALAATNVELQRAREFADAETRRARANFQELLRAVDTMLTKVGDVSLRDVPRMSKVRSELLQEALRFYAGFLAEHPDDPNLRIEASRIRLRAAEVHGLLGEYEAAAEKVARVMRDLGDRTGDVDLAIDMAKAQYRLASAQRLQGDLDSARPTIEQAMARWQAIPAQHDARVVHGLADARIEASFTLVDCGDIEGAIEVLQQSIDALAAWNAAHGDDAPLRHTEARTLDRAGVCTYQSAMQQPDREQGRARVQRALALHQQAAAMWPDLLAASPDAAMLRAHAAENAVNVALVLTAMQQFEQARPHLERAVAWFEEVVAEFPSAQHRRSHLATTRTNFATLLVRLGDSPAARRELAAAQELYEDLVRAAPDSDAYQSGLAHVVLTRASMLHADGEHESAFPLLEQGATIVEGLLAARPAQPMYRYMRRVALTLEAEARLAIGEGAPAAVAARGLLRQGLAPNPKGLAAALLARAAGLAPGEPDAVRWRDEARSLLQAMAADGVTLADLRADPMTQGQVDKPAFAELWAEVDAAAR
jgi:serine/threonine protein kinase